MNAAITTIKNPDGTSILYPKTKTEAVYDNSNNRLDQTLSSIQGDLGSKSSASAVSGNDAFSKISTLNSELTNNIHIEEYNITVSADANSPLGYYGAQVITSDVATYGTPIGISALGGGDYPAIGTLLHESGVWYATISVKNNNKSTVRVVYCKHYS